MSELNIPPREYAEWCNIWFEQGADFTTPRVMLIGDSITVGYRALVNNLFKNDGVYADMVAGSRCAGDPALDAEIECCLGRANGYDYKVIHFNNGLHGGCNDTLIGIEHYEAGMRRAIELIKKLQPNAKLVLVTSTPQRGKENPHGSVDEKLNGFVLERNEIVKKLAAEYGLEVDDLFSTVAYKPEYEQPDGVHYGEAGKQALAEAVYNCTKKLIF